ncbi:putative aconitate hydratase protein [Zalerion maritima]|uniref:Large ribosomal subunit protein bL21m n=1 Tax=Zalerion maritima TaxID=339359 RepID=A0AAD5WMD6_9PEZI|nr:putative aconitate hydratase protein [Zalerion maritima]
MHRLGFALPRNSMSRPLLRSIPELRILIYSSQSTAKAAAGTWTKRCITTTSTSSFTGTSAQIEPTNAPPPSSSASVGTQPDPFPTEAARIAAASVQIPQSKRLPPRLPTPAPVPLKPLSESVRELLPALRAQHSHYVTVHIHGFPYLVTMGDQLRLPARIPGVVPGDVLRLNRVSILGSRDYTLKGSPFIDERFYECRATVIGIEAEPMRVEVKKKQRCRRKTTVRNKMRFTVLRISELKIRTVEDIEADAAAAAKSS